eukprot:TRINITY_DN2733_c0_g1_i1.p1 TRINITY_DN2733_c0_g1~~TRINITY_DN2733_c0_g1_i1.p1  ORF type:complete len:1333 (+),score=255.11 TRINITY_DN2733_c0_g1_i1:15-4013(+)
MEELLNFDGEPYIIQDQNRFIGKTNQIGHVIDEVFNGLKKDQYSFTDRHHFDMLYSCLCVQDSVQDEDLYLLFNCLSKAINSLVDNIHSVLKNSDNVDNYNNTLFAFRNSLKMYMYLYHSLVLHLERKSVKTTKKSKKLGIWTPSTKEVSLETLYNILQLDLVSLWHTMQLEESFLNAIIKIMFYMLGNSQNTRLNSLNQNIYTLASVINSKYITHCSNILTTECINLLFTCDHAVKLLVNLLKNVHDEAPGSPLVLEVVRSIATADSDKIMAQNMAKNIGSFVALISEALPEIISSSLSLILPMLDREPYHLRNGVISGIGSLIIASKKSGTNDPQEISKRDSFFNILFERFHDVTSYSRKQTVQTWTNIAKNRAVPLRIYVKLTKLSVERLCDKTNLVRKNAMKLLVNLLYYNPYSPHLRLSKFEQGLDKLERWIKNNFKEDPEYLLTTDRDDIDKRLAKKLKLYEHHLDTIEFIKEIDRSIPIVSTLLGSKNITDSLESIKFLVALNAFNLEIAKDGMKNVLTLIWSKEESISNAVIDAFVELYMTPDKNIKDKSLRVLSIAKGLINFVEGTNLGELTSFDFLLTNLMKTNRIPKGVISVLWEIFEKKDDTSNRNDSYGALVILCMFGNADPSVVKHKLDLLITNGLGERAYRFPLIAKYCCIALQKIGTKFPRNHIVFKKIRKFLESPRIEPKYWFPAAEQAICAVYEICENPDVLMSRVIKEISLRIFPKCFSKTNFSTLSQGNSNQKSLEDIENSKRPAENLSKLLFILGHVSLKQLVYVENIHSEINRKRGKIQNKKKSNEAIEIELGIDDASDYFEEEKQAEVEKNIVEMNLLGTYGPLISFICSNESKLYNDIVLKNTAVLTMCKFMCVSPDYCERNLELLFSTLEGENDSNMRANIIIALGDFSIRFPNVIEPWTHKFYERLHDSDVRVRKNTIMVLTHLILNNMIRMRGHIYEMAYTIQDPSDRIRDLSKLFYIELSNKGPDYIYNIIPETIGALAGNTKMCEDSYQEIMKYLFSFIRKDKHVESLVEKLCSRIRRTENPYVWRDIVYCLILVNFSERSIKKLSDGFRNYKSALVDDLVYEYIHEIIQKGLKTAKGGSKNLLEELNTKVDGHKRSIGSEDPPRKFKKRPKTNRNIAVIDAPKRKKKYASESSSSEDYVREVPKKSKKKAKQFKLPGTPEGLLLSAELGIKSSESDSMDLDFSSSEESQEMGKDSSSEEEIKGFTTDEEVTSVPTQSSEESKEMGKDSSSEEEIKGFTTDEEVTSVPTQSSEESKEMGKDSSSENSLDLFDSPDLFQSISPSSGTKRKSDSGSPVPKKKRKL